MEPSVVPYVEDGLGALVEQSFLHVVGRSPTRAERLSTVARLQAEPQRASVLADLLGGGPLGPAAELLLSPGGAAWR